MEELPTASHGNLFAKDFDESSECWPTFVTLYEQAFPEYERVSLSTLLSIARQPEGHLTGFFVDGAFCGFAHWVVTEHITYVCFLATMPGLRSQGIGSSILAWFADVRPGLPVVVDTEQPDEAAPNNAQRLRRQAFYLRNGFRRTGWCIMDGGMTYDIFATGDVFDPDWEREAVGRTFGPPEGPRVEPADG